MRRTNTHNGTYMTLGAHWWTRRSIRTNCQWYTAGYPWTPAAPGTGHPSTMDGELTDFASVQKCLARCCDEVACLTEASDLVCHPDGSCERTWHYEGTEQVSVKATIEPVVFLGRQVMDITITIALAWDHVPFIDGSGGNRCLLVLLLYYLGMKQPTLAVEEPLFLTRTWSHVIATLQDVHKPLPYSSFRASNSQLKLNLRKPESAFHTPMSHLKRKVLGPLLLGMSLVCNP
ncbi:hypothetical protein N657DRAFT_103200 [Parathielavia appendiculata]|uniref:Uncharacterized protein n=1 Tax=Parathielavia appendiculata TaxID=2587402 RepID=A0AAN6TWI3_9PEZI|nr:hypothetical protein N657DRAFT_103200 [Parathielavia appendiculata]